MESKKQSLDIRSLIGKDIKEVLQSDFFPLEDVPVRNDKGEKLKDNNGKQRFEKKKVIEENY